MTRQEVHKILSTPFYNRVGKGLPVLEWEHCAKKFYQIPGELALGHLIDMSEMYEKTDNDPMVLKCEIANEAYYFGIGLDECETLTLRQIRKLYNNATWYVYTWAD